MSGSRGVNRFTFAVSISVSDPLKLSALEITFQAKMSTLFKLEDVLLPVFLKISAKVGISPSKFLTFSFEVDFCQTAVKFPDHT